MNKSILDLATQCEAELRVRDYSENYIAKCMKEWERLVEWMKASGISEFTDQVALQYLDDRHGMHYLVKKVPKQQQEAIRAIRLLISLYGGGDFEFRTPSTEKHFDGVIGETIIQYLDYLVDKKNLSDKTIKNKRYYLHFLCKFMIINTLNFSDMTIESFNNFVFNSQFSISAKDVASREIKLFFRYLFENKITEEDKSLFVPKINYNKRSNIPTTYTESEISSMLNVVDRASPTGKRDYVVLLLAAEYGWRTKDIISFKMENVDWEENTISITIHKTGVPAQFPLLASVGNALIDYYKNGRPETPYSEVIVSLNLQTRGKPLNAPTIHSIVSKYLKQADIADYMNKKHGAHSLRHSLAANMLKNNESIHVVKETFVHLSTESTNVYANVDFNRLKLCPVTMPPIESTEYLIGGDVNE